jgi:hypothetical protein
LTTTFSLKVYRDLAVVDFLAQIQGSLQIDPVKVVSLHDFDGNVLANETIIRDINLTFDNEGQSYALEETSIILKVL